MPLKFVSIQEKTLCHGIILLFTLIKLLTGICTHPDFELHGDELFYLALGDHLAWGYKETSPTIAVIAHLLNDYFDQSVFSIRLLPSLAGAAMVAVSGMICLALGGRKWAMIVTSASVLFSPALLATGYMLQPVVFDELVWTVLSLLFVLILKDEETKRPIILAGIVGGLGLLTKYSIALYIVSFLASVLVTKQRSLLLNRKWITAGSITALMMAPNIYWQSLHQWPIVEQLSQVQRDPIADISPVMLVAQLLQAHAVATLVWIPGLFFLLLGNGKKYRPLGISFIILIVLLVVLQGKPYYAFGIFPLLMAAGGVFFEKKAADWRWIAPSLSLVISLTGLIILPSVIPLFSLPFSVLYFKAMTEETGIEFPLKWDDGKIHHLPQYYASMLGWRELARKTEATYRSQRPTLKGDAVIYCPNYTQAGAISVLSKAASLPPVISPSSSFRYWAPHNKQFSLIIYITAPGKHDSPEGMPGVMPSVQINQRFALIEGTRIYIFSTGKGRSLSEIQRLLSIYP